MSLAGAGRGTVRKGIVVNAVRASIATLVAAAGAAGGVGSTSPPVASAAPAPIRQVIPPAEGRISPPAPPTPSRAGPRSARRIEELAGQLGLRRLREIRAQAVTDLNRAAGETFGPFSATGVAIGGRRGYFDDHDVELLVTRFTPTDLSYVAVPLGTTVTEEGEIVLAAPAPDAYSAPAFDGPWGASSTAFFTATNTDGGGAGCANTSARTILRASWRKLADLSSTRDYWGLDLAAVAEVTEGSGCNDFVDDARIGFRSTSPGAVVVAEEPITGRTQRCSTRTVSVGSSWGGVSGSVSQTFTHCEQIGVTGAFQPAATSRTAIFDNNGSCHAGDQPFDGRELAQVAVVQVPQGTGPGFVLSFGVNAGNASTCKEDAC